MNDVRLDDAELNVQIEMLLCKRKKKEKRKLFGELGILSLTS